MAAEFTQLQKNKLIHMFELLDVDGDGVLAYDDFRMTVEILAQERGLGKTDEGYLRLVESNKTLWRLFSRHLDINNDGSISSAEWLAFHIAAFVTDPLKNGVAPELSSALHSTADYFLELLDPDSDQSVTVENYITFCSAYNVGENEARIGFDMFDLDGNGRITQSEVVKLIQEFYLSDDPESAGNLFFGSF